jgi:hypothetical protein
MWKWIPISLLALLSACVQWQQVRPYTDFVNAEIKPGDELRIKTRDGATIKLIVLNIRDDRIIGENQTVLLEDISLLEKNSNTPPANPCSPQIPLGCSVPQWATVLHSSQARYQDYFYRSCEQHDYCYRHGAVTYGKSRTACDYDFLQDMQEQCHPDHFVKLALAAGSDDYATCNAVAMEFYLAVQQYGANRFKSTNSTYCEYDGPP